VAETAYPAQSSAAAATNGMNDRLTEGLAIGMRSPFSDVYENAERCGASRARPVRGIIT
jgi:hypothetical protein